MNAISHISALAALLFAASVFAAEPTVTSEELTPEIPTTLPKAVPATPETEKVTGALPTPTATTASAEPTTFPAGSEIAIILSKDRFFPNQIRLRAGVPTALVFTTVNKKPAALVIEPLSVQRWVAAEASPSIDRATAPTEITRELNADRVTTISFEPVKGKYGFHDALSGARGEIIVE